MSSLGSRTADVEATDGAGEAAPGKAAPTLPTDPDRTRSVSARTWRAAGSFGRAVVDVLPAWIVARILVTVSLVLSHLLVRTVRPGNAAAQLRVHQGLLSWDGGWYEAIAGHGYVASGAQSVRFYPGVPMAARVLGSIPGVGVGTALIIISNLCALAAMAVLLILVRQDFGDAKLARRSVWLFALAPPAYALVLGYADSALILCAVVTFFAVRSDRWWWAGAAGLVAGLVRPVGILLVVPIAIELWRTQRSRSSATRWLGPVAALAAPVIGTAGYLWWVGSQFGDPWLPFRVQEQNGHRGAITVPLPAMWHDLTAMAHGHHVGSALHVPWVLLCLVLLVVAFRRLPISYAAFTAVVLAVSMTSSNLDSFERYALGAFPLVIAASTLTGRRGVEWAVLIVSAVGMLSYACLAFLGVVVP